MTKGIPEDSKNKDLSQFERRVITSRVAVYFDYDTAGNVIIERARIPDQHILLEDLLDDLTEPSSNCTCKAFDVNHDDLPWLEEWKGSWQSELDDGFFCYVCANFSLCEEPTDEDDTDKFRRGCTPSQTEYNTGPPSGRTTPKKGDKPFRKFLK